MRRAVSAIGGIAVVDHHAVSRPITSAAGYMFTLGTVTYI